MRAKLVACALACLLAGGVLSACAGGSSSAGSANSATSSEAAASSTTAGSTVSGSESASGSNAKEQAEAELDALPEKFPAYEDTEALAKAMSVTIEGHTFNIPCQIEEFLNEGWQTEPPSSYKKSVKAPSQTIESGSLDTLALFKDDTTISVLVSAPGDEAVAWRESKVMGVEVSPQEDTGLKDPNFSTGDGIKLSMTAEDITNLYGKPYGKTFKSDSDQLTHLSYKAKKKNTTSGISFNTKYFGEAEIEFDFDDSGNIKKIETWYGLEE